MVKSKWLAALSDGTTVIENEAPFDVVDGKPSSMQQLKAHMKANDLRVTGMRAQVGEHPTLTVNTPSHQKTPGGRHEKWPAMRPLSPDSYDCWRWATSSSKTEEDRHQLELRAVFTIEEPGEITVSVMVDEDDGNEIWVVVRKEEE